MRKAVLAYTSHLNGDFFAMIPRLLKDFSYDLTITNFLTKCNSRILNKKLAFLTYQQANLKIK